ncbi:MAG: radical SAM protein, partial [Clostridia bacterium]|nr:radical SAM protein [Clostridia bacterium]
MELYIHIPFCVRKCTYCDFASFAGKEHWMRSYIDLLLLECDQQLVSLHNPDITSIYIGGGTPSILPAELFQCLLQGIHARFHILPDCEWTCEANPGTLTPQWLDVARQNGVNRLSMGMQAKQSSLLSILGRIHEFSDVQQSVSMAKDHGIENISLD